MLSAPLLEKPPRGCVTAVTTLSHVALCQTGETYTYYEKSINACPIMPEHYCKSKINDPIAIATFVTRDESKLELCSQSQSNLNQLISDTQPKCIPQNNFDYAYFNAHSAAGDHKSVLRLFTPSYSFRDIFLFFGH